MEVTESSVISVQSTVQKQLLDRQAAGSFDAASIGAIATTAVTEVAVSNIFLLHVIIQLYEVNHQLLCDGKSMYIYQ